MNNNNMNSSCKGSGQFGNHLTVNGRPYLFDNSKGKSEKTDNSNLGIHSSGCGVNGFRFNSDYKRAKPSGPPISASKFEQENDSQSLSMSLKKANYKPAIFSPEVNNSTQKLYKDKNLKSNFNDEAKLRGESIRVNGLAADCIMED